MKIHNQHQMWMYFLCIVLLLYVPVISYSQESGSCAEKLENAQSYFDKGQVELVASIICDCMESGFNREESLLAYKLLIQTYLFEDRLEKADSAMLDFLKKNPEYELSPTDHSIFVSLFNTFKVKPVVQISVHFGTNIPYMTFVEPKPIPGISASGKYSTQAFNFYGSVEAKFKLLEKLEINIEPGYSQLAFTNTLDILNIGTTIYTETQNRIDLPLSVTYNIKNFGKVTPYLRLGFGPALTLSSVATASYEPSDINGTPRSGTSIDRKDSRFEMDLFTQVGAGIKYKTRGGYLFAEVRSNLGIFNQTIRADLPSETHSSAELGTYYFYSDDDFNLNTGNFSIGYTQIFYKPSKRKE
jgi:Outer membrane protein beta-barrel domain